MNKQLYIIGAGSVGGHLALNIKDYSGNYEIGGFFDDDVEKIGSELFGHPVIGPVSHALDLEKEAVIIGIAFPKIKKKIFETLLQNSSLTYPSLVHDRAWISKNVSIGRGSVIYPGTAINYGSEIGDFVVMNMNCALGHHTRVGNYASLAPNVSTGGHTIIEESVDMGIGSSTVQDVTVGSFTVIGGQAMVLENIPPGSTAVGVPARIFNNQG